MVPEVTPDGWTVVQSKYKKSTGARNVWERPEAGTSIAGAPYSSLSKKQKQRFRQKQKREEERKGSKPEGQGPSSHRKNSERDRQHKPEASKAPASSQPGPSAPTETFSAGADESRPTRRMRTKHGNRHNRQKRAATYVAQSAQAPPHNEPAKRTRLDDTVSPRGDSKKIKLDSARRADASYAEIAQNDLCVAIVRADNHKLTDQQATLVKEFLEDKILADVKDPSKEYSPIFLGKPIVGDGVLKLWCEDEQTKKWLVDTVDSLSSEECPRLGVKRQSELSKRVRAALWLPDCKNSVEDTSLVLNSQNRWALVNSWTVYSHSVQGNGTLFLKLGIPETVVPLLVARKRRLAHNLGSVYVRFYAADGTLQDEPYLGTKTTTASAEPESQPGPSRTTGQPARPAHQDGAEGVPPVAPVHSSPKPSTSRAPQEMNVDPAPTSIGSWGDLVDQEMAKEKGHPDDGDPNTGH